MKWLQDKVYSIRDVAAINLKRLAEEFGPDWAMQHIVPHVRLMVFIKMLAVLNAEHNSVILLFLGVEQLSMVLDMVNNPHYLHRMTVLRVIHIGGDSNEYTDADFDDIREEWTIYVSNFIFS